MNASIVRYEKINDNDRETPAIHRDGKSTETKEKNKTKRREEKIIKNLNAQQSGYVYE